MPFLKPADKDVASYAEMVTKALEGIVYKHENDFPVVFAGFDTIIEEFNAIIERIEQLLKSAQMNNPDTANQEVLRSLQSVTFFQNVPMILEDVAQTCDPSFGFYNLQHTNAFKELFVRLSTNRKQEILAANKQDLIKVSSATLTSTITVQLPVRPIFPSSTDRLKMEKYNIGRTTGESEFKVLVQIHETSIEIDAYISRLFAQGIDDHTDSEDNDEQIAQEHVSDRNKREFESILQGLKYIFTSLNLTYSEEKAQKLNGLSQLKEILSKLDSMHHLLNGSLFSIKELEENLNEEQLRLLLRNIKSYMFSFNVSLCDKDALFALIKKSHEIEVAESDRATNLKALKIARADKEKLIKIILPLSLSLHDLDDIDTTDLVQLFKNGGIIHQRFLRICKHFNISHSVLLKYSYELLEAILSNFIEIEDFCEQTKIPMKKFLELPEGELLSIFYPPNDLNTLKILFNYYLLPFEDFLHMSYSERLQLRTCQALAAAQYNTRAKTINNPVPLNAILSDITTKIEDRIKKINANHSLYDVSAIAEIPEYSLGLLRNSGLNFAQTRALYDHIHGLCLGFSKDYMHGLANDFNAHSYKGIDKQLLTAVFDTKDSAKTLHTFKYLSNKLNEVATAPHNFDGQVKSLFPEICTLVESLKPVDTAEEVDAIVAQIQRHLYEIVRRLQIDPTLELNPNRYCYLLHYLTHSVIAKKYELFPTEPNTLNWQNIAQSFHLAFSTWDGDSFLEQLYNKFDGVYNFDQFFCNLGYLYNRFIKRANFEKNEAQYINFNALSESLKDNPTNSLYAHAIATCNPKLIAAQAAEICNKTLIETFLHAEGFMVKPQRRKCLTFAFNSSRNFVTEVINLRNDQGETPLTVAVQSKKRLLILALLLNGADPTLRNSSDQSALDIAQAKGLDAIVWDLGLFVNKNKPVAAVGCLPRWRLSCT